VTKSFLAGEPTSGTLRRPHPSLPDTFARVGQVTASPPLPMTTLGVIVGAGVDVDEGLGPLWSPWWGTPFLALLTPHQKCQGESLTPAVGVERDGIVYKLFVSTLPSRLLF
jgi:hypothetical protein